MSPAVIGPRHQALECSSPFGCGREEGPHSGVGRLVSEGTADGMADGRAGAAAGRGAGEAAAGPVPRAELDGGPTLGTA